MRLNKSVKNLAVALPMVVLSACSSNSNETEEQSQVETNTEVVSRVEDKVAENNVQVTAAKRAAEIAEQKRQQLEAKIRAEHIVYFDFDVSKVTDAYAAILDAHASFLNANTNVKVLIEGHADERGTPEYNIALGERRAKAVATYLENMGVSQSQMKLVSYGEEKPMIKDRSENAFAKNRRAVLVY